MPHRPLVNLITWHLAARKDDAASRVIQFAPISFDASFQEIFTALTNAQTLLLVDNELRLDRGRLLEFLSTQDVHEIFAPQVVLEQLAEEAHGQEISGLPLRHFYQAGEALRLSPAIVELFERRSAGRLHNYYGPTESHVVTAFVAENLSNESGT